MNKELRKEIKSKGIEGKNTHPKFSVLNFNSVSIILYTLFLSSLIFAVLSGASQISLAQTDGQFRVSQEVTGPPDVDPPSIPQNLVATAVSSSQINLSWDASTDNVGVTGYKIFRDSVEIDTTAGTSYSDTGLLPSTTYSYTVSAFDAANNESAESDPAEATTFSEEIIEEEEPTGGGGGGSSGSFVFEIKKYSVQPGNFDAQIRVETNLPSGILLRWGKTPDYEIGSLVSNILRYSHIINIADLSPDTIYYFEFEVSDGLGRKIKIGNQKFKTLPFPFYDLPLNVSNLRADPDEEKITLLWRNPPTDFKSIRIIRSKDFFPRDYLDGELVYEARGEMFIDRDVQSETIYYYGVFVEDYEGRFSSGSLVSARLLKPGEPALPIDLFAGVVELPPGGIHPLFRDLRLEDFDFIQEGEKSPIVKGDTVVVKGDRALKISLDYKKLPEVLKTLAITLRDPDDPQKIFHFLLRVNSDKTSYEASIAPLERDGLFGMGVTVLDHKNRGLKKLSGILKSILPPGFLIPSPNNFWPFLFLPFLTFLVLILVWKLKRKKNRDLSFAS